jgi:hypothetical protein
MGEIPQAVAAIGKRANGVEAVLSHNRVDDR